MYRTYRTVLRYNTCIPKCSNDNLCFNLRMSRYEPNPQRQCSGREFSDFLWFADLPPIGCSNASTPGDKDWGILCKGHRYRQHPTIRLNLLSFLHFPSMECPRDCSTVSQEWKRPLFLQTVEAKKYTVDKIIPSKNSPWINLQHGTFARLTLTSYLHKFKTHSGKLRNNLKEGLKNMFNILFYHMILIPVHNGR